MGLRIGVDRESCQSSGRCVKNAPGAFRLDADHLAEATDAAQALPDEEKRAIARDCPALAIHLQDDQGRDIDP